MTTATAPEVLRARPHLHCAPVEGGVYVDGARDRFVLRGWDGLFAVVDRCLPLLERGASEDELVLALGTEKARGVIRRLTRELGDHGMLLDPADAPASPPAAVRARFGETLTHLEAHAPRPYEAFAAVRVARVALVGPEELTRSAARALERAGVGEIVLVTGGDVPGDVDAALACTVDGTPTALPGASGPVVPVRLGRRAHVVGPAVLHGDARVADALGRRVAAAAEADGRPPVARPLGDALAGALAGHLLFELLTGLADPTAAYVVHGNELAADRVTVARPPAPAPEITLADTLADPVPDPDDPAPDVRDLHGRWTGPFALSDVEGDLPSLPVIVRAGERRVVPRDRVLAWEAGEWYSAVALALAVLRRGVETEEPSVAAAGTTRTTWLLDGALRALAPQAARLAETDPVGRTDDPERERLGRYLDELGGDTWSVTLSGVDGLPWRLARITRAGTGVVLGAAWAPDTAAAVRDALGTAVARAQATSFGGRSTIAPLSTQALMDAGRPAVRELRSALERRLAARGEQLAGRLLPDPVLGDLLLPHGPVSVVPAGAGR